MNRCCYIALTFRRSSAVEQLTVNQLVVGSIPTAGAKISLRSQKSNKAALRGGFCFLQHLCNIDMDVPG